MRKIDRLIEISWDKILLEEAIWRMENHDGESYIDGDEKKVVLVE